MDRSEDSDENAASPPVFVDDTGRRRALVRRVGRLVALGFAAYLALLAAGFARDPRIGAIGLPTFGLPQLVHPETPPVVLGEATARTASEGPATTQADGTVSGPSKAVGAGGTARDAGPSGPNPGGSGTGGSGTGGSGSNPAGGVGDPAPAGVSPTGGAPGARPAPGATSTTSTTTTTGPSAPPGHSKGTTTTTTTSTTAPPSSTTSTTAPGPGNSGSSSSSGKGPDGSGPPGQLRKTTTTTTPQAAG